MHPLAVSIVVPVYNEHANVLELCRRIAAAMAAAAIAPAAYEMVFVDDGSTDGTGQQLKAACADYPNLRVLLFARNFGQTAAISAGFEEARGEIIVAMDGDLQNDPADIPRLLAKLAEGYDVVSGWRRVRHDGFILRRLPSLVANKLISLVSGVHLHDYGCTLKAYRAEYAHSVRLYGEMHRFIPIYAYWEGARVAELEVTHHPRIAGKSKYGLVRTFKVILDLLTIKFLSDYSQKPIYLFGSFGLICWLGAGVVGVKTLYERLILDIEGIKLLPPTLLTMLFILSGMLSIFVGLLAEVLLRIFYEVRGDKTYRVRERVGAPRPPP